LLLLLLKDTEAGGYFLINGNERCVRLLQVPRRNFAAAIQRGSYKKLGSIYTDLGVAIRCARYTGDESSITNTLHYLTTGGVTLKFVVQKQTFLIPVILVVRALSGGSPADAAGGMGITDEELYRRIVQGDETNTFLVARAGLLLQDARARFVNLHSPDECLAYIGSRFRRLASKPPTTSDVEIGHSMLNQFVMIHLQEYGDKLECLLFMIRKLYSFAAGDCGHDDSDSLQNQEVLMPGSLLSTFVKEKFEEGLRSLRMQLSMDMRKDYTRVVAKINDPVYWGKLADRAFMKSGGGIGKKVSHFLSTGNIISSSGLDQMQVSGYTIVAERLNFLRFTSHFRSIHRGQFFMEMKTTTVRKLRPDQWGFLCPVHTPDGGPCGLLSHLALKAQVITSPDGSKAEGMKDLAKLLISLGVVPCGYGSEAGVGRLGSSHLFLPVLVDGRVIGGATSAQCKCIATYLRSLKVGSAPSILPTTEIASIAPGNVGSPYPGLYLFTGAARLSRPVLQLATGKTEMIGPFEQAFMDIACLDEDVREGITTHQELDPTNMLSLLANLTPFSDQNQSPRNMYQCQVCNLQVSISHYILLLVLTLLFLNRWPSRPWELLVTLCLIEPITSSIGYSTHKHPLCKRRVTVSLK
jgi:DNA-directed RNA polymerase I subunit RPA2